MVFRIKERLKTSCGLVFSLLLVSSIIFSILGIQRVFAAEKDDYVIQISPTKQNITLKPGETYEGNFRVRNVGKKKFSYDLAATPYWLQDETYDPNYSIKNNYTKIADWVKFDKNNDILEPNQASDIHYKIEVPKDVPAGGQYMALMAQTKGEDKEQGMFHQISRVGLVVYAQVEGQTRIEGKVLSHNISPLFLGEPIKTVTTFSNSGNVDFKTKTITKIKEFFTNKEVFSNEEDPEEHMILPETRRVVSIVWEETPMFGIFTINQNLQVAGTEDQTIEKVVFVMPLWLVIIVVFVIVFGVFWLVFSITKKHKK